MYHSIYIDEKNTWDDFYLIPETRPVVNPPEVRTMYVDIPGKDGALDLSTALTGFVLYKNREGSWTFIVDNDHWNWEVAYHTISNYLHGKRMKIILEDDPNFYYIGRLAVDEWKSEQSWSKIVIKYNLEPFKYELTSSVEEWLWDPFSFETGVVRESGNITIPGTLTIIIPSSRRPVIPTFVVSANGNGMTMQVNGGTTYTLYDGTNRNTSIIFGEEETTLELTGTGVLSIIYQGGWL